MVMPEDGSLCPNRVAKFAANSSGASPTPRRMGACTTKRTREYLGRDVLNRVEATRSGYVIALLGDGTRRFTELTKSIDGSPSV